MRRFLFAMLAVLICVSLLSGCDDAFVNNNESQSTNDFTETSKETQSSNESSEASTECRHNWGRIENFDEYTAVDKCSICGVTQMYTDPDNDPESEPETGFKMLRYNWDGYGVRRKNISSCDLGYAIIDCLSDLQETGAIIPSVSGDEDVHVVNEFALELPVARGTVWIECGSVGLFRLNPEMTEICRVQTHLGEGKALQMTDTLTKLLVQAWYYYPHDYWSGTYENGTVTLDHVYPADSSVEWVEIEDMHIDNKIDSCDNKITLSIRANESKTVTVRFESYQSDDNLGSLNEKEIELVSGEETSVELTFYGFYYTYFVSIGIDNTVVKLAITPQSLN